MDILGIGPLELAFIFLLILLVIGPKDLEKTARTLGRTLNNIVKSDNYRMIQRASHELRNLPTQLMRDANLEAMQNEVKQVGNEVQSAFEVGSLDETIRSGWSGGSAPAPNPVLTSPPPPELTPPAEPPPTSPPAA